MNDTCMWESRIRPVFLILLFVSVIAAVCAQGRPAFSQPIRSVGDFDRAFHAAGEALALPDIIEAQRIMEQALAWARANPGTHNAQLIAGLFRTGHIAALERQFDRAEALFREDMAVLDASNSPDQLDVLYEVLRRILELSWINGHGTSAIAVAKRLSLLSPSQIPGEITRLMGTRPAGLEVFRPREEPRDRAFRVLRSDLDRIVATLINEPAARVALAEAVITRNAAIQDVMAGSHIVSPGQEDHPPALVDALATYSGLGSRKTPQAPLAPLDMLRANAAAMSLLAYADPHITPDLLPRPALLAGQRTDLAHLIHGHSRDSLAGVA